MRIILAVFMAVLLVGSAQAQQAPPRPESDQPAQHMRGSKRGGGQAKTLSPDAKAKKASAEEKAAKAAIELLPDKPYDPWHTMRK
jgi:hypothetical protein